MWALRSGRVSSHFAEASSPVPAGAHVYGGNNDFVSAIENLKSRMRNKFGPLKRIPRKSSRLRPVQVSIRRTELPEGERPQ